MRSFLYILHTKWLLTNFEYYKHLCKYGKIYASLVDIYKYWYLCKFRHCKNKHLCKLRHLMSVCIFARFIPVNTFMQNNYTSWGIFVKFRQGQTFIQCSPTAIVIVINTTSWNQHIYGLTQYCLRVIEWGQYVIEKNGMGVFIRDVMVKYFILYSQENT
jgi:hypothetical protein